MRSFKLQTRVDVPKSKHPIRYEQKILSLGSCFSDNVANHLQMGGLNVLANPFGTLYNPLSMHTAIQRLQDWEHWFTEADLFEYNGLFQSELHHGSFSHEDAKYALSQMNEELRKGRGQLNHCSWLLLTFGSSRAYWSKRTERIVANCHKRPASDFERIDLSLEEMFQPWKALLAELLEKNPTLRVLVTVSPIRHLGDGLVANTQSKAKLLLFCHMLEEQFEAVSYFPSYEIMMDELRDYRYYADDLKHPSSLAVAIICQRFVEAYLLPEDQQLLEEVTAYKRMQGHLVLHAETSSAIAHIHKMEAMRSDLLERYPFLKL